jgi:transcriptional regulator with XRE-family HTH domain
MGDMRDIFGENVRRQRKARGWTQEHLAELAGVSRAHLAVLETAKVWPSIDMVEKVSTALEIPASRLFFAQGALTDEELAASLLDRLGYEPVLVPKKKRARG